MQKSTNELLKILQRENGLKKYLEENVEQYSSQSFTDMLEQILKENSKIKSEAIDCSNIEKHYAYQIFQEKKTPSRDKLIMLCVGMEADMEQTTRLLRKLKFGNLDIKDKRDGIIIHGILHGLPLIDINISLDEQNLKILE